MKPCWCEVVLGLLVIVFAWWTVDWAVMALTILGIVIVIKALMGTCCCKGKCETKEEKK